jgi:hypothetical protein
MLGLVGDELQTRCFEDKCQSVSVLRASCTVPCAPLHSFMANLFVFSCFRG